MFQTVRELPRSFGPVQESALLGRVKPDAHGQVDMLRQADGRATPTAFSTTAGVTLAARRPQRTPGADPWMPLMARICQRDESALHALHAAASGKVFAAVLRIVRRPEFADEVVSATFLQAWRTASTFDTSRATVMTWLLTIARSRAIDALRRHQAQCQHECARSNEDDNTERPGDGSQCPRRLLELSQLRRRLAAAMFMLSPIQRQILTMTYLAGDSHEEVALRTGMPLGTVKSHARRAIAALRASPRLRIDAD